MDISIILFTLQQIIKTPFDHPDVLWIALPLLVQLTVMELYFGKYHEKFGGSSTVSNSLVFVFVGIDLLRYITQNETSGLNLKFALAISILLMGIIMAILTFFHDFDKFMSKLTSFLVINTTTYLVIVAVYANLAIDVPFIISSLILLGIIWIFFRIIDVFIPDKT